MKLKKLILIVAALSASPGALAAQSINDLVTNWLLQIGAAGTFAIAVAAFVGLVFLFMFGVMIKSATDENNRTDVKPLQLVGTFIGAVICFYLTYLMVVASDTVLGPEATQEIEWSTSGTNDD